MSGLSDYLTASEDRNVIWLTGPREHYKEAKANAALSPGHIIEKLSTGKVRKHATYGAATQLMVAIEDSLQGNLITDAYETDDPVRYQIAQPGDKFQGRLPAGAAAVVVGDRLMSNGDGCLIKIPTNEENLLYSNTAASAAVTSTNVETAFDKSYTIPANTLKAGDVIHIFAQGIATGTANTDTLTVKLYIGATEIATTGAVDVANNDVFVIGMRVVIRTIGTGGTFVAAGFANLGVEGTATTRAQTLGSTAINTTTTQAITVKATWSTSDTVDTCRLDILNVSLESGGGGMNPLVVADQAVDNSAGVAEEFIKVFAL